MRLNQITGTAATMALACAVGLVAASRVQADIIGATAEQATNATLEVQATMADTDITSLAGLEAWIKQNGHVNVGELWQFEGHKGIMLEEAIDIVHYTKSRFDGGLGIAHATQFTDEVNRQYVGLSLNAALTKAPPKIGEALTHVTLSTIDFQRIYIFGFFGLPPEDVANGRFSWSRFAAGGGAGCRF